MTEHEFLETSRLLTDPIRKGYRLCLEILIASLGEIDDELNRVLPTVTFKQGEHIKFLKLLDGKGEYAMIQVDADGNEIVGGIGKILEGKRMPHLQLLGDIELQGEAQKICNLALEVYWDLFESKHAPIKGLTKYFYERGVAGYFGITSYVIWDVDGAWDAEMKSDNRHFINNLPGQVGAELVRTLESYKMSQFLQPERRVISLEPFSDRPYFHLRKVNWNQGMPYVGVLIIEVIN